MSLFRKKYHTLAIIGNGFDLNHGYKTGYENFKDKISHPDLDKFRTYCENEESITTWFSFEENIRILSERLFRRSMTEECDFDANRREVEELTRVFKSIHSLLCDYLARETASAPLVKKPCIARYLNKDSVAINFNYTKTAEEYTKNVIYVHGSLEEKDILLGFDYRDIGCLEQFEDMRWSKDICRESLAFRRHFRKRLKTHSKRYEKLLEGLESYQHWENTGRGLDDEITKDIPEYTVIDRFLKKYRAQQEFPDICYKDIETIAVLGHGIEADRVYLQRLTEKCQRLKEVVIYRHDRESDAEFQRKADFFRPYCDIVIKIDY